MVETVLSSPLFMEAILPFLLIFTIVFAVLQKTKVLGDGKRQIDAIVAFVVGLIVIAFGYATGIILAIVPVLAIGAVVLLIFMLLYGMAFKTGDFDLPKGVKGTIGVLASIAVVVALMVATGTWDYLVDLILYGESSSEWFTNIIFIIIIAAVVGIAFIGSKEKKDKKD